jgi:hypothetical protein
MAPSQGNFLEKEGKSCLKKLDGILRSRNLSYGRGLTGMDLEIIIIRFAGRGKIRIGSPLAKFLVSIGLKSLYV